ncbi:hypothetical protein [Geobacillus zalihae]|uniref:hypothetical protein n=1 Tax=Geobacillus zalihae TaxID=213419 RepID=UPI0016810ABE|nr:hypothetical protein [Geobacillus zalihae]QNU24359.1 hypothetical protein IC806_15305 [Geobacillus zalihae]
MIWSYTHDADKEKLSVGIKGREKFVYEFSLNNTDDTSRLPAKEHIIDIEQTWYPVLRQIIIDHFSQPAAFDMDLSDENITAELNTNFRKTFFLNNLRKLLQQEVGLAVKMYRHDLGMLLLLQRFIQTALMLANPLLAPRLASSERKDISVFCYILRMYVLYQIVKLCRQDGSYPQLEENVVKAYKAEFSHFCDYLYEESFQNYRLPKYAVDFCCSLYQEKIQLDDVVNCMIINFLDSGIDGADTLVKEYLTKLANGFYLPRYNILSYLRILKKLGWARFICGLILKGLASPRLAASIIIGLLPVLLTGELYNWYYDRIYEKHEQILIGVSLLLLAGTFFYLFTETKNFLGFNAWSRVLTVFTIGLIISLLLVWLTKSISTEMLNQALPEGETKTFSSIPVSLFIFQTAVAYFLGIVLQAIWEDKPITQPL